jgi:hypothetical protein
MIAPFAEWPSWLKAIVIGPNIVLIWIGMYWWPKTKLGWRKLGFLVAYLLVFLLVMNYIFHW